MVEHSRTLVKTPRVPRISKPEALIVEVVAELMAERTQKCAEGCDLLADGCPHPDPDQHGLGVVVPEKFRGPTALADAEGAGGQDADFRPLNLVEISCHGQ
jgi:hypothetical protein